MSDQSFDPFAYCDCPKCSIVSSNSKNDIWLHEGTGKLTRQEFDDIPAMTEKEDLFENPCDQNMSRIGHKPSSCIWFSNGSWLFDRYCNGEHDKNEPSTAYRVAMIQSPKNILKISTLSDMETFVETYSEKRTNMIIWSKIIENGYYGVSFNFRKMYHITTNKNAFSDRFSWHLGFDCETLCILDTQAFDNKVTVVDFEI